MNLQFDYHCKSQNFLQTIADQRAAAIHGEILIRKDETVAHAQGYRIRRNGDRITVFCSGDAGAMYGILDVLQTVELYGTSGVKDEEKTPYVENRGIKFNIPLDARTPSYSDAGDAAQRNIRNMWDFDFWKEFLDQLAENKYNVLSLWNLQPFPSMVHVPEYPEISLDDVMCSSFTVAACLQGDDMVTDNVRSHLVTVRKMTMDEKMRFWQKVMEYADERCIRIYVFTWNTFTFGTEYSGLPIDDSLDNEMTKDYFRKAVTAMLRTYPLLAGIGVTAGEHMKETDADEPWLADTYGAGIDDYLSEDPTRDFVLIHRAHYTNAEKILKAFSQRKHRLEFSFKYSQAHMYANTDPSFGNAFFEQLRALSPQVKTWLTVRNDDYYMFRWADPDFARSYIKNMPHDILSGFYMGPDGYIWGREYLTRDERLRHRPVTKKMWMMTAIWGQISYDPDIPTDRFRDMMQQRFPHSEKIWEAWRAASGIIPRFQCTHWRDLDFQWYPESCCRSNGRVTFFADVNEFIDCPAAPGSGYTSVREYGDAVIGGEKLPGISPMDTVHKLREYAQAALTELPDDAEDAELMATIEDIRAMAILGKYYANKLEAAVLLYIARKQNDQDKRRRAVSLLEESCDLWNAYSRRTAKRYYAQMLTRFLQVIDLERLSHYTELDVDIARYQ